MKPRLQTRGLFEGEWWEHLLRFTFGGVVTVATGLVAKRWGPGIGGLFLAFPSILPASLTFVRRHDGCRKAADDARGARLGAIGMAAFALTTVVCLEPLGNTALVLSALAWTAASVLAWLLAYGRA